MIEQEELARARNAAEYWRNQTIVVRHTEGEEASRARKRTLDETVFDYVTRESCYWVGLLMADGSILRPRPREAPHIVLQLSSPDTPHVARFRAFLRSDATITKIKAGVTSQGWNRRAAARMTIYSRRLADRLSWYGVKQDKAKTGTSTLYNFPDYWRGVCDGDGSIRTDAKHSLRMYGSKRLVQEFALFAPLIYPNAKPSVAPHGNIWGATLCGPSCAIILDALYNAGGPALPRKRKSALKIMSLYGIHGRSDSQ